MDNIRSAGSFLWRKTSRMRWAGSQFGQIGQIQIVSNLSFQENIGFVTKRLICKSFKSNLQAQKAWSEMLEEAKLLQVVKYIEWIVIKFYLTLPIFTD